MHQPQPSSNAPYRFEAYTVERSAIRCEAYAVERSAIRFEARRSASL
jgi:hypothetical protein